MEVPPIPAILRCSVDSSDRCDLPLSIDPDIVEEKLGLVERLKVPGLVNQTPPGFLAFDIFRMPVEFGEQEVSVLSATTFTARLPPLFTSLSQIHKRRFL